MLDQPPRNCWSGYRIAFWDSRVSDFQNQRLISVSFATCASELDRVDNPVTAVLTNVPERNITALVAVATRYCVGGWSSPAILSIPDRRSRQVPRIRTGTVRSHLRSTKMGSAARLEWELLGYKLVYAPIDTDNRASNLGIGSTIGDPKMWSGSMFGITPNTSYGVGICLLALTYIGTCPYMYVHTCV